MTNMIKRKKIIELYEKALKVRKIKAKNGLKKKERKKERMMKRD